ncbi:MAG: hypothetical protein U0133_20775 [Gemmatimonadales bacterium]
MPETSISGEAVVPGSVGVAVRAMAFGTLLGTGLIALALWGSRLLVPGGPTAAVTGGPVFMLVVGGTFAGIGMAVGVAWALMRGVPSLFRRGGLAILTGFLTVICMLPTGPINALIGPAGLAGFALLCFIGCLLVRPRAAAGPRAG